MLPLLLGIIFSGLTSIIAATNSSTTTTNSIFNILKDPTISKPGCLTKCGNLIVPYPFGIRSGNGSRCGISSSFEFICKSNQFDASQSLFIGIGNTSTTIQIFEISDNHIRVSNVVARKCYNKNGLVNQTKVASSDIRNTPFSYSELNRFTVIGCDDTGTAEIPTPPNFITGCQGFCRRRDDVVGKHCSGKGCCQTPMPRGIQSYSVKLTSADNHSEVLSFNRCGYAFLGEDHRFDFQGVSDLNDTNFMQRVLTKVPIVLDWWIGNLNCTQARNSKDYACRANSHCVDSDFELGGGYRCNCKQRYEGNPYLDPGCTDIVSMTVKRIALTLQGVSTVLVRLGNTGMVKKNGKGCNANYSEFPVIKVALGIGFSFLAIVIAVTWLYFSIQKRRLLKLREKFFRRNGGFLLKQQISSKEGSTESTKIFTAEELEKATNGYADDRILGRGGHGIVYNGILADKRLVAIKKSSVMDETQIEQFINEVVILTQINNRNVVQLLGCCLESEVPLLVYEYVSNGTLFEHIQNKEAMNWLSWENRLRVASEAAGALSYLHSAASIPIIHRDVKSANILLDEYYTAKISDFGASRLIPLDQTKVTTVIMGTIGYLDPEYFHSSHLTEKSDVYSFGVVLAELLTGGKPIDTERGVMQLNLTTYFITSMKENRLFQILDPRVMKEGSLKQLEATAELVKRCLHINREDRPTMREVAMELEVIRKFTKNPWTQQPVIEEPVGSMDETGSADLYTISINPSFSTGEFSGQRSLSSTSQV